MSGAHLKVLPDVMRMLREQEMGDILVVVGGIFPEQDEQSLLDLGIAAIFRPGTPTSQIVEFIEIELSKRANR